MIDYMEKRKQEKITRNEPYFEIRIGINTGPVVAGVVGKKKFAYDVWGDMVNVASRLESTGEPGKINVSRAVYQQIKHEYDCEYRGKLEVKNRGKIDMYFVTGKKSMDRPGFDRP